MTVEEIIQAVNDIPTFVTGDDIKLYHKYASSLPEGSIIFDMGTGMGKSAIALALSNPNVEVFTVDNGDYPVMRGWVNSLSEYIDKVNENIEKHGVGNITFLVDDVFEIPDLDIPKIDLFHLDFETKREAEALKRFIEFVTPGGILLIRNSNRLGSDLEEICSGCKKLESGMISVYQKPQ